MYKWGKDEKRCKRLNVLSVEKFLRLMSLVMLKLFKGDFIFREDVDGIEFISIMFEMKNEMDETATKHKNEDFFKELDRDRREKGCEYAVLVSLLEIDNELYNNGIVDVSYKYEKMYVIRPQFFIPMITLLRNAALNSLKYRQEACLYAGFRHLIYQMALVWFYLWESNV